MRHPPQDVQLDLASRYNGPGSDEDFARTMLIDKGDKVYVLGQSYTTSTRYDYATIKFNSSGVLLWLSRFKLTDDGVC